MTGDAPQPGETPREESNPWTFSDPDTAFWRGDDEREAERGGRSAGKTQRAAAVVEKPVFRMTHTGEAADAHAAGSADVHEELVQGGKKLEGVEHMHENLDSRRFTPAAKPTRPLELPTSQQARLQLSSGPRTPIELPAATAEPEAPSRKRQPPQKKRPPERQPIAEAKQPEPVDEQPTVPGQSRLAQAAARPPSPLLETSPFWLSDEERAARAASWPEEETRQKLAAANTVRRKQRQTKKPAYGLLGLIGLGLVAAFFAWVSAEPFWLAAGHGHDGLVTVTRCTGDGISQRCVGSFQASGDLYTRSSVTVLGVEPGQRNPGAVSPARMVNPHSRQAYVGEVGPLVQLRWILGFVLVLACGIGIAALTGSRQLENVKARRRALAMSLAGPLFLLLGFLLVAY